MNLISNSEKNKSSKLPAFLNILWNIFPPESGKVSPQNEFVFIY